ncbi:MAG: hypothetical protein ACKO4Y_07270 [Flavobacteriales bacterium]
MKIITWLLSTSLVLTACVKYEKPVSTNIAGTYRFDQVIHSSVGN